MEATTELYEYQSTASVALVKTVAECAGFTSDAFLASPRRNKSAQWQIARRKIQEMYALQDDWDGNGATAPSPELVYSADRTAQMLDLQGVDPPCRIMSSSEGTIVFEWQSRHVYSELEVIDLYLGKFIRVENSKPTEIRNIELASFGNHRMN
jgi:hypothetical protein